MDLEECDIYMFLLLVVTIHVLQRSPKVWKPTQCAQPKRPWIERVNVNSDESTINPWEACFNYTRDSIYKLGVGKRNLGSAMDLEECEIYMFLLLTVTIHVLQMSPRVWKPTQCAQPKRPWIERVNVNSDESTTNPWEACFNCTRDGTYISQVLENEILAVLWIWRNVKYIYDWHASSRLEETTPWALCHQRQVKWS